MDKHITIEWPYEKITLDFTRTPIVTRPLLPRQWALLERAEKQLYHGEHGANPYTDVMPNEGDTMLREIWDHTLMAVEATMGPDEGPTGDGIWRETAHRVAAVLAIMSFGKDFLLK